MENAASKSAQETARMDLAFTRGADAPHLCSVATIGFVLLTTSAVGVVAVCKYYWVEKGPFDRAVKYIMTDLARVISSIYQMRNEISTKLRRMKESINHLLSRERGHLERRVDRLGESLDQVSIRLAGIHDRVLRMETDVDQLNTSMAYVLNGVVLLSTAIMSDPLRQSSEDADLDFGKVTLEGVGEESISILPDGDCK